MARKSTYADNHFTRVKYCAKQSIKADCWLLHRARWLEEAANLRYWLIYSYTIMDEIWNEASGARSRRTHVATVVKFKRVVRS